MGEAVAVDPGLRDPGSDTAAAAPTDAPAGAAALPPPCPAAAVRTTAVTATTRKGDYRV